MFAALTRWHNARVAQREYRKRESALLRRLGVIPREKLPLLFVARFDPDHALVFVGKPCADSRTGVLSQYRLFVALHGYSLLYNPAAGEAWTGPTNDDRYGLPRQFLLVDLPETVPALIAQRATAGIRGMADPVSSEILQAAGFIF